MREVSRPENPTSELGEHSHRDAFGVCQFYWIFKHLLPKNRLFVCFKYVSTLSVFRLAKQSGLEC
jgi:hypothetical protein